MNDTTPPSNGPGTAPRRGFEAGTDNAAPVDYVVTASEHASRVQAGKVTGHGEFSLRLNDTPLTPPAAADLAPGSRRPVVVLLDGCIRATDYLDDGYYEQADDWPASQGLLPLLQAVGTTDEITQGKVPYPSHYAHATFVAGLLRQVAPDARVLSVPVATPKGSADETRIVAALRWLLTDEGKARIAALGDLAVVLLPSGRRLSAWDARAELAAGDPVLEDLRRAVVGLGQDVTFVTSSGNWGTDDRVYPAWFAQDLPNVVSVAALDGRRFRAPYSSWGDWVRAAEVGTHLLSCTPFEDDHGKPVSATWSGTSFAAAVHAGRLAQSAARLAPGAVSAAVVPMPVTPQEPPAPDPSART